MRVKYHSRKRSGQTEIMDDFSFKGAEMKALLKDLRLVNTYLGGNSVTIAGIKSLIRDKPVENLRILDVGCGDGEMLRTCADYFSKHGINTEMTGIDANPNIISEAKRASSSYDNIQFEHADVFNYDFKEKDYDLALCNLFLHHFDNEQVERIISNISKYAKVGIVVNDLHRSRLAFVLFRFVSILLLRTRIARIDGLISIARAFKRSDFERFSSNLGLTFTLKWKWAFRYQWIIKTPHER